jgi:hypothetical protein
MLQIRCGRLRHWGENRGSGWAGGGDIRGVQLAAHCKHAVGVCDTGEKTGGADDRADGGAGGGDILGRRVKPADLGPACKAAFFAAPAQPSTSQQQVSDTLRGMGLWVEDEFQCPIAGSGQAC